MSRLRGAAHSTIALPPLARACAGEVIGTYLLTFFGCGSVMSAVITGAQVGLWQVAVVWGFGITMAIYATAAASGAHLNPSVSLSLAWRRPESFPRFRLLPYWTSQLVGAFLAAATLYACFAPFIKRFVAIIISVLGPLTQAGLNPARDFGPRLFAYFAGWGSIAIPGPNGSWWAYVVGPFIVGPFIGGPLGALLYDLVIRDIPRAEEQGFLTDEAIG